MAMCRNAALVLHSPVIAAVLMVDASRCSISVV
jgi:hypothetical protein